MYFLNLSLKLDSRENPKKLDKVATLGLVQSVMCQGYEYMKQECPTYLKSIGKSKALATTLSDIGPEVDLEDSDQEGTFMAFTATIKSPKESKELVDEEEELMESKFEKID